MKNIAILSVFIFSFTACSPPAELAGEWRAEKQECYLTQREAISKQELNSNQKYNLYFNQQTKQFKISYFNQEVQSFENKKLVCNIHYSGNYSYNFLTSSVSLNFLKDREGVYQTQADENCGLKEKKSLKVRSLAQTKFFKDSTVVKIRGISQNLLQLDFPNFRECASGAMTVVFQRK